MFVELLIGKKFVNLIYMPIKIDENGQEFAEVEVAPAQPAVKRKMMKEELKQEIDNLDSEIEMYNASIDKLKAKKQLLKSELNSFRT